MAAVTYVVADKAAFDAAQQERAGQRLAPRPAARSRSRAAATRYAHRVFRRGADGDARRRAMRLRGAGAARVHGVCGWSARRTQHACRPDRRSGSPKRQAHPRAGVRRADAGAAGDPGTAKLAVDRQWIAAGAARHSSRLSSRSAGCRRIASRRKSTCCWKCRQPSHTRR